MGSNYYLLVLVVLFGVCNYVNAQGTFMVSGGFNGYLNANQTITVTASGAGTIPAVTLSVSPATNILSGSTLNFGASSSQSFVVVPKATGTTTITFVSADNANWPSPVPLTFTVSKIPLYVDTNQLAGSPRVNTPADVSVYAVSAPAMGQNVIVTAVCDPVSACAISAPVTVTGADFSDEHHFKIRPRQFTSQNVQVSFTLSGADASSFVVPDPFSFNPTQIGVSISAPTLTYGRSAQFVVNFDYSPVDTLTVQLVCNNSVVEFSPAQTIQKFADPYNPSLSFTGTANKPGDYELSMTFTGFDGTSQNFIFNKIYRTVDKLTYTLTMPTGTLTVGDSQGKSGSIQLSSAPAVGDTITGTFNTAGNLVFDPTSFVLSSSHTGQAFTVRSVSSETTSFSVSFNPDYVVTQSNRTVNVQSNDVTTSFGAPITLSRGQKSELFSLAAAALPSSPITVQITAPNGGVSISPASITFSSTSLSSTYQVTALDNAEPGSYPIHFTLSGGSASNFNSPSDRSVNIVAAGSLQVPSSIVLSEGQTSTFVISLSKTPVNSVQVNLAAPAAGSGTGGITFTPAVVTLTAANPSATISITATQAAVNPLNLDYNINQGVGDGKYYNPAQVQTTVYVNAIPRPTAVFAPTQFGTSNNILVGDSVDFNVVISPPVPTQLIITPSAARLQFVPTSVTLTAGQTVATFTVRAPPGSAKRALDTITFSFSGTDAALYDSSSLNLVLDVQPNAVYVPSYILVDSAPTALYQVRSFRPPTVNGGLVLTPSAAGLIFTPSSISFNAGQATATFSVATTSVGPLPGANVFWAISGPEGNLYEVSGVTQFPQISTRTVDVTFPSSVKIHDRFPVQFRIDSADRPAAGSLDITILPSAGLTFEDTTLTIDGDHLYAQTYAVAATATQYSIFFSGPPLSFSVSMGGSQAALYVASQTQYTVTVNLMQTPTVSFAVSPAPSNQYEVGVGYYVYVELPDGQSRDLTITPVSLDGALSFGPDAPGVPFTSVRFTASGTTYRQAFIVTPTSPGAHLMTYTVTGPGASDFYLPTPDTYTIDAIITSLDDLVVTLPGNLHVGQQSAPIPIALPQYWPNDVTFTLSAGADLVITPSVLTFTGDMRVLSFTVTPTAAAAAYSQAGNAIYIQVEVSGQDSDFYQALTTDTAVSVPRKFLVLSAYSVIYNAVTHTTIYDASGSAAPLAVGVASKQMYIQLDYPITGTVNLYSTNAVFNPTTLIFADSTKQSFTVTATEGGEAIVATGSFVGSAGDSIDPDYRQLDFNPVYGNVIQSRKKSISLNLIRQYLLAGHPTPAFSIELEAPAQNLVITPKVAGATVDPASFTFSGEITVADFVLTAVPEPLSRDTLNPSAASALYVSADISGLDVADYDAGSLNSFASTLFYVQRSGFYVESSFSKLLGSDSPVTITLDNPTLNGLVISPVVTVAGVTFNPSTFVFPANSQSASAVVTVTNSDLNGASISVEFIVGGTDAAFYDDNGVVLTLNPYATFAFASNQGWDSDKKFLGRPFTGIFSVQPSTSGDIWESITLTPQCQYMNFEPNSITLTAGGVTSATFTSTYRPPQFIASNSALIDVAISGPGAKLFQPIPSQAISFQPNAISVDSGFNLRNGQVYTIEVALPTPVTNGLSIGFQSSYSELTASPSSLTFAPGEVRKTVSLAYSSMNFVEQNNLYIKPVLSGLDAGLYSINTIDIYASGRSPVYANAPGLVEPNTRQMITFDTDYPVVRNLTINLSGSGVNFESSQIVLLSGAYKAEGWFWLAGALQTQIQYSLSGFDAPYFYMDVYSTSVDAIIVPLSDHIVSSSTQSYTLVAGVPVTKTFRMGSLSDDMGAFTLTPRSQYLTFTPAEWTFTAANPTVSYTVVSSGVPGTSFVDTVIYQVGGPAADYYDLNPATSTSVTIRNRAFTFHGASLSASSLAPLQDYSFDVEVNYPSTNADLELDIIAPAGLTFTPSTLKWQPNTKIARCVVRAQRAGAWTVSFTPKGTDAPFFVVQNSQYNFQADPFTLAVTSATGTNQYVGRWVEYTLQAPVAADVSLALTSFGKGEVEIQPASVSFATAPLQRFRVRSKVPGTVQIGATFSGAAASAFENPQSPLVLTPEWYIGTVSTPGTVSLTPGQQFYGFVSISPAPTADVTITPSASGLTFSPASFTFGPNALATPLYVTSLGSIDANNVVVTYGLSGASAGGYAVPSPSTVQLENRKIHISTNINGETFPAGVQSPTFSAYIDFVPTDTVTVTPTSAGVTFNPSSFVFTADSPSVQFTFTPLAVQSAHIVWALGAGGASALYEAPADSTITVALRDIEVTGDSYFYLEIGQSMEFQIFLEYPTANGLTLTPSSTVFTYNPATVVFPPGSQAAVVTISAPNVAPQGEQIVWVVSGADAQFYISSVELDFYGNNWRGFDILDTTNTYLGIFTSFRVGVPKVFSVVLDVPTKNGLTITPSSSGFTFSPVNIAVAPNTRTASFTITPTIQTDTQTFIDFAVSGADAALFAPKRYQVQTSLITLTVPSTIPAIQVGVVSRPVQISLSRPITGAITVTPSGAGLTFNPATLSLSATQSSASFTVTAAYPSHSNTPIVIHYAVSGSSAGAVSSNFGTTEVTAVALSLELSADWSDEVTVGVPSKGLYVALTDPSGDLNTITALGNVPVAISAPGCDVTPASVTLTSANIAQFFTLKCNTVGTTAVRFTATSPGEWLHVESYDWSFNVVLRNVISPSVYPDVYVGAQSAPQTLAIENLPLSSVTFTPFAADTVFTPAAITFTSASTALFQQFSYVSNAIGSPTIYWTVTGADAAWYEVPTGNTFDSNVRTLNVNKAGYSASFNKGASYTIAFSTPIAPKNSLTITPSGLATFSPASVTITSAGENPTITVTPTGFGAASIYYTLSGPDAAWYDSVAPDLPAVTQKQTFVVGSASTRYPKVVGEWSSPITIRTPVASTAGVTVVPSSPYMTFTPASLTFNGANQVQTFQYAFTTQAAYAVSSHQITFAVSGPDASSFARPSAISISVSLNQYASLVFSGTGSDQTFSATTYVGIPSNPIGIRASSLAPTESITITPFTSDSATISFSPSSFTLTAQAPEAFFTFTAWDVINQVNVVSFAISGPGAAKFEVDSLKLTAHVNIRLITVDTQAIANALLAANVPSPLGTVSISVPPPTGSLTVTIQSASGNVEFNPTILDFGTGLLTQRFSVTGTRPSDNERVFFTVAGDDADYYAINANDFAVSVADYAASLQSIEINTVECDSSEMRIGVPCEFVLYLGGLAPLSNTTVRVSAPGFTFSPEELVIRPPFMTANLFVTAVQEVQDSPVLFEVANPADSGYATFPAFTTLSTETQGAELYGCFQLNGWDVLRAEGCTITLSSPAVQDVVVTAWSDVVTFPNGNTFNITTGSTSATILAVGSVVGLGSIVLSSDSVQASSFSTPTQIVVYPRSIRYTANRNTDMSSISASITAGDVSQNFDFFLAGGLSPLGSNSQNAIATPTNFTVSWLHSSSVRVIPEVQVVSWPMSSFSVAFTADSLVSNEQIVMVLTGADAALYAPTPVRVYLTASRRAFITTNAYDSTMGNTANGNGNQMPTFVVGVESRPITLSAMTKSSNVFVHLSGQGLSFNPSVLRYTGTYESLTFTVTATSADPSPNSWIHYTLTGPDAGLFDTPQPTRVLILHNIIIPDLPSVVVGRTSDLLTIRVASGLTRPIVLQPIPSSAVNVAVEPKTLLLSPEKPYASFRLIGLAVQHNLASKQNPNDPSDPVRAYGSGVATTSFQFAYKNAATNNANSGAGNGWVYLAPQGFNTGAWAVSVIPGTVSVSYSTLRIGRAGYVNITVNPPPRANLLITPVGNNLNFFPSTATFTSAVSSVQLQVTAAHADYATSDEIPFTVAYVVSGLNYNDYVEPANSFLAVSRGGANAADDLVLGAAPALALPSLLLAVVVAFVLMF